MRTVVRSVRLVNRCFWSMGGALSVANRLPGAHHFVTTVYFDTAARDVFHASQAEGRSLKIRAKEYYDLAERGPEAFPD